MQAKIKILRKKLIALYVLYSQLESAYTAENSHEALLYEHILEMSQLLNKLMMRGNEKSTLKLSPAQALAFCQLWSQTPLFLDAYEGIAVNSIVAEIDQTRKNPARRIHDMR